jgi:stage II sporulation protein GA (sporulation sigma-E factor processing peptidase)
LGASAIGAASAVIVSIFPWMDIMLRFLFMNVAVSALMLRIAFGRMKTAEFIKQLIVLYLITYFVGGLINSVYYYTDLREKLIKVGSSLVLSNVSWWFVIIIFLLLVPVVFLLLWFMRWYQSDKKETYEVELFYDNHSILTIGLMDTGNCLYDPLFKKPVMVMEASLLQKLLTEKELSEINAARNCLLGNDENYIAAANDNALRLRFIPYQSIGRTRGIMPGLILDKVLIHTKNETICNEKVTAAICDNHLTVNDDYHVLLHKKLI